MHLDVACEPEGAYIRVRCSLITSDVVLQPGSDGIVETLGFAICLGMIYSCEPMLHLQNPWTDCKQLFRKLRPIISKEIKWYYVGVDPIL